MIRATAIHPVPAAHHSSRWGLAALLAVASGCVMDVDTRSEGEPRRVAHQSHAVINGWIGQDGFMGVVELWYFSSHYSQWLGGCSGTVVRNNTILTARHCVDGESQFSWGEQIRDYTQQPGDLWVKKGADWAQAREVYAYPDPEVDAALVLLETGLPMYDTNGNLSTTGYLRDFYQGSASDLHGKGVLCVGYGATSEGQPPPLDPDPLSYGFWTAEHSHVNGYDWLITPKNSWDQTLGGGDSGGPCFDRLTTHAPVVAINAGATPSRSMHIAFSEWQDWMMLGLWYTANL